MLKIIERLPKSIIIHIAKRKMKRGVRELVRFEE